MRDRGESNFIKLPAFAASLYSNLLQIEAIGQQYKEIADELVSKILAGRILDIGAGSGQLLREIYKLNPEPELHGLDISAAMVGLAKRALSNMGASICLGNIRFAPYRSEFFDLVTATGSLYLWNHPLACLQGVFRILKLGKSAILYETYQDYPEELFKRALWKNLRTENILRKFVTPLFLKKQLRMTISMETIRQLLHQTPFSRWVKIERFF